MLSAPAPPSPSPMPPPPSAASWHHNQPTALSATAAATSSPSSPTSPSPPSPAEETTSAASGPVTTACSAGTLSLPTLHLKAEDFTTMTLFYSRISPLGTPKFVPPWLAPERRPVGEPMALLKFHLGMNNLLRFHLGRAFLVEL